MKTHLPWKELGYAIGGLALLLGLYVGAYAATVTRTDRVEWVPEPVNRSPGAPFQFQVTAIRHGDAEYPSLEFVGNDLIRSFFSPIHEADRRLRSEFWRDKQALET